MMRRLILAGAVLLVGMCGAVQAQQAPKIYNTAKQKLLDGKQVVGGTVFSPDPAMYCAMANAGFDFLWIEMQHSPLTYQEVARMIFACRGSAGMPFIRVPDATESDIQKATDIGAIGVIVPTVDTVEKAEAAVKWTKYPPFGRRSQGGGQYRELWGNDYRQTANDNMMVVIMIETPEGVANAEKIAAVPGIDVIFAASTDLGNFSGPQAGRAAIRGAGHAHQRRHACARPQARRSARVEEPVRIQLLPGAGRKRPYQRRCTGHSQAGADARDTVGRINARLLRRREMRARARFAQPPGLNPIGYSNCGSHRPTARSLRG
jgi:4-hydroxy-2-oxoheptanedioate aldolase